MSAFVVSGWATSRQADRRFMRLVWGLLVAYVIAGVWIPFIQLVRPNEPPAPDPSRYATLLPPPKPVVPPPAPLPKPKAETPQKTPRPPAPPKPELTQEQKVQQAREKALQKMQALNRQFRELQDRSVTAIDSTRPLTASENLRSDNRLNEFKAAAAKTSNGIAAVVPSERRTGETQLGQRQTTSISSPVGFGTDSSKAAAAGTARIDGRGEGEIQDVFDRAQGSFYAIFSRAMRENPAIHAGKLVVSLTIAPDGSVTDCKVVSNSIGDAAVAEKIVQRIKLLRFPARNIPPFTYAHYPIAFQPMN